jgi:hypothetical protein
MKSSDHLPAIKTLRRSLVLCALLPLLPAAAADLLVGPNVQVSATRAGDTHYEVLAAADPKNPNNIIVGSFIYPDENVENGSIVYSSSDGGASWQATLEGADLYRTSDPAVAFGPDNVAYYVAAVLPADDKRTMRLFRSTDGGRTWDPSYSTFTYSDREYVTVDTTGGKYHGRVYVNGNNRIPKGVSDIVMFYSTDQGRNFKGPGKRAGFGKFAAGAMGNAVVASDGTIIAIIGESDRERAAADKAGSGDTNPDKGDIISSVTSIDGGESWTDAVTVDRFVPGGNRKGSQNNVNAMPVLAIDPGSAKFRDRLYAAWPDRREGHSRIYFASSSDKGATWTKARPVDDTPSGTKPEHLMVAISVNKEGIVGVTWYDRRNHADNLGWDVRFSASMDGGATFLPSVQVSERGTKFDKSQRWTALRPWSQRGALSKDQPDTQSLSLSLNTFIFMGGDTTGLVATADGRFHPVWVDSRTGTPQVWTAAVTVRSAADAARKRPEMQSVTSSVALEFLHPRLDRESGLLTGVARIVNTSSKPVRGPFVVRARSLTSDLGELELVATAGETERVWVLPGGELAPGKSSDARAVQLKLTKEKPFKGERRYNLGLMKLDVAVEGAK